MLSYEFKKLFGKRRMVILIVLFALATIYCTITMSMSTIEAELSKNRSVQLVAFDNYIVAKSVYESAVVLISVTAVASFFPVEIMNNTLEVMLTSKFGKNKLALTKIVGAFVISNSIFFIYLLASLFGYVVSFGLDFEIPITEGLAFRYMIDPNMKTFGDWIFIDTLGFLVTNNIMTLLTLFVSLKLKKGFTTLIVIIVSWFVTNSCLPITNVFLLDVIIELLPPTFAEGVSTYKELFSIGSHSISALDIGFVIYIILIAFLILRVKSAYQTRGFKRG